MPLPLEHQILQESKVIAVVAISENPLHPSHRVASYLRNHGYRVVPVNPELKECLDGPVYPDVASIPVTLDVVDIFLDEEEILPVVEQAIARGVKAVWMQEGIVHKEAAEKARAAGLKVVMDRCLMHEHQQMTSLLT